MNQKLSPRRRALSLLLALSLILGLLPGTAAAEAAAETTAQSEHWASGYLSQMVEWGFIRADQAADPDKQLTRADFMSIVNRAYGYTVTGPTPFEDVSEYDWFYDDVGIAYTAGYINGTSPTTAAPNDPLNRETATTILGRNMMLQESPGELLDFSDARDISNWARGTIKSSMEHYLVTGYDDGTFRPQQNMNWGEIAALVTRTIGTPLQDAGEYSLGGVFGNVTVTAPGVTLRDTVISGDLYVTGGVGLGGIKLENVTVLGRIIASGTGSSEGGASILLRNVTADELLVDNLQGNEVSIRADGVTEIGKTTVRTSAYIEDNTPDGLGLHMISLEGDAPPAEDDEEAWENYIAPKLTLAGRIEEVVNRTPGSTVHAAKGTVAKLTVDETAEGSNVIIDRGAVIKELVLDTGTTVTGEGDITKLEVNAPGCNVAMLPDEIEIRPGITAIIAGEEMDSTAAEEASLEPLILAGYPKAQDVAPTSLESVFATNKKGTIYWAVSAITDGSVGADDLIKPPSYGNIALRWGTLVSPRGNEETVAQITGLQPDGSYYLSAVLEDARGQVSPVKVISFTTPDNTVPAFAQGYPQMSKVSRRESVAVVMPTKDCKLYYALLPQAAQAPTANELKTGSVSGALGYGVQDVYKNVESAFRINDRILEEQTTYTVYFWLTDANGANSSAVVPLTFTTADETPPTFLMGPLVNNSQDNSVGLTFRLSENGTVFWAVVPEGEAYPKPEPGQTGTAPLDSDYAKLQVASGLNALVSGRVTATEGRDGTITVTGLEPEKAYDFYYVAQDTAGNYSITVGKLTINTRDNNGPKVSLSFTSASGQNPRTDTAIVLEFSENVRPDENGPVGQDLLALYNATLTAADKEQAKKNLRDALDYCITLYQRNRGTGTTDAVAKSRIYPYDASTDWVIDYAQAVVTSAKDGSGKIQVTIPASGHQLASAGTYFFRVHNITDNAGNHITPDTVDYNTDPSMGHNLPIFTVVFAEIYLTEIGQPAQLPTKDGTTIIPDAVFRMIPQTTHTVVDGMSYDLLLWTDTTIRFELYYRVVDSTKAESDPARYPTTDPKYTANMPGAASGEDFGGGWVRLGTDSGLVYANNNNDGTKTGVSLHKQFNGCNSSNFPALNKLDDSRTTYYEFAINILQNGTSTDKQSWSGDVNMDIYAAAGTSTSLSNLASASNAIPANRWEEYQGRGLSTSNGAVSVGTTDVAAEDYLPLEIPFTDVRDPNFQAQTPKLNAYDTYVSMDLNVDRACRIYYVIAPVGAITTTVSNPEAAGFEDKELLEKNNPEGSPYAGPYVPDSAAQGDPNQNSQYSEWVTAPDKQFIWKPTYQSNLIKTSSPYIDYPGGGMTWTETVTGLQPETDYFAYFVLEGDSTRPSKVYLYTFTTTAISRPKVQLERSGNGLVTLRTDKNSYVDWIMFTLQDLNQITMLSEPMSQHLKAGVTLPSQYANFTVLQAMMTPASLAYSVFDEYANETSVGNIKESVASLIRTGTSVGGTGSTDQGTITTTLAANATTTIDTIDARFEADGRTQKMTPGTQYIVLSVAYHRNADKDNVMELSYKAIDNIFVSDTTAPTVTAITTTIEARDGSRYKGSVTISFSKELYYSPDGGKAWAVYATGPKNAGGEVPPDGAGTTDDNRYIELLNNVSGNAKDYLYVKGSGITRPSSSFTFYFDDMPAGAYLELFTSGDVCNASGYRPTVLGQKMRVTFIEQLNLTQPRAGFSGTWGGVAIPEINLGYITDTPISGDINIQFSGDSSLTLSGNSYTLTLNDTNLHTVTAALFPTPTAGTYFVNWSVPANNNVVQITAGADTSSATFQAIGMGETTATITITPAVGNRVTRTIRIIATATPTMTLASTGSNTVQFTEGGTTATQRTLAWQRATGTNPSATITFGFSPAYSNTQITWSKTGTSVNINPASDGQSAVIQAMSDGRTVITVEVGTGSTKQSYTIDITVTGGDTPVGSMLNITR